jgi:hypothetical protein
MSIYFLNISRIPPSRTKDPQVQNAKAGPFYL